MMRLAAIVCGGSLVFLLGFAALAAVFWPKHPILDWTPLLWIAFVAMVLAISALAWPLECRVSWIVDKSGIVVNKAGRQRAIPWAEIKQFRVAPFGISMRIATTPHGEGLPFPCPRDAEWLKQIATECIDGGRGVVKDDPPMWSVAATSAFAERSAVGREM